MRDKAWSPSVEGGMTLQLRFFIQLKAGLFCINDMIFA